MTIIKPVLDYFGLSDEPPDDARSTASPPAEHRRTGQRILDVALPLILAAVAFGAGWIMRSDEGSAVFAERPTQQLDDVIGLVGKVGVECSESLDRTTRSDGGWAICRGTQRFSLHVSPTIEDAYASFDSATLLGCYTVGGLPHQQWYVARADNWNLLTHARDLADDLARLPGVSITVGMCDVPTGSVPA